MRRVISTVLVAMLLTGCATHVVKPEEHWHGALDDRAGATAVNIVRVPMFGVKCFFATVYSTLAVIVDAHEEASNVMHNNCAGSRFLVGSKEIREAVPEPLP